MRKFGFIVLILLIAGSSNAGDVIRIVHNNLMQFGNYFSNCTQENNNPIVKQQALKTIIEYIKPDIFTVNELSYQGSWGESILDNVMNYVEPGQWAYQQCAKNTFGGIGNGLYYKKDKFQVVSVKVHAIGTRYADVISMRTKNTVFENEEDYVYFTIIIVHLKAGNGVDEAATRAKETKSMMDYINRNNIRGNVFIAGDLNVYGASEQAFQNLLYYQVEDVRFFDPVNQIGEWHDNSYYSLYMTQSTHSGYETSCFSGGGLDDRFDFILTSGSIIGGNDGMVYVNDTYKSIGNDGRHFNQSIISSPTNALYPVSLLDALYDSSDHLPVKADFELRVSFSDGIEDLEGYKEFNVSVSNPVVANLLKVFFKDTDYENYLLQIISLDGRCLFEGSLINTGCNSILLPDFNQGIYIARFTNDNNNVISKKIIIK